MKRTVETPRAVLADMRSRDIDVELSLDTLDAFNRGEFDGIEKTRVSEVPGIDGERVVDFAGSPQIEVRRGEATERLHALLPEAAAREALSMATAAASPKVAVFDAEAMRELGILLLPRVAFGVLNGGSATSYADETKNGSFSADLLALLREPFDRLAELSRGRAKGLTPAYLNPDGSPGFSYLQLKMRNLLLQGMGCFRAYERIGLDLANIDLPQPLLPLFQMTSVYNDEEIAAEYEQYRGTEPLTRLIEQTGADPTQAIGAVQPLLSAFTHSEAGRPKEVFAHANGNEAETLPLPGGHGQNFAVLADTYRRLRANGKRFAYLGNVDNLGSLPDPLEIGYLALCGAQAGFDFAIKTPVDVKGGILIRDQHGKLNCADIGPAISKEEVARTEAAGTPVLFNAATGLFDLDYLVPRLDQIARELPTRFSDQDKDAGRYSQTEQVTWEVLGLLDEFVVFSVDKYDRMLAAKLLLESLMTSGIKLDDPAYPTSDDPESDLRMAARKLHAGLQEKLDVAFGLTLTAGRWVAEERR